MPSLNFVLPHWLYWFGLVAFPLAAMCLVARQKRRGTPGGVSLFIAYMFWLWSGFLGLHRFYLRSPLGLGFLAVFAAILYCNAEVRDLREDVSRTRAAVASAHATLDRARSPAGPAPAADSAQRQRGAETQAAAADAAYATARAEMEHWRSLSRWAVLLMAGMLLIDAVLIPGMVARVRRLEAAEPPPATAAPMPAVAEIGTREDPTLSIRGRFTDAIEWVNVKSGEFVAYWAMLAVFAYYYEVVARYVLNSPTNWVHESMFLMFGIQYMIAGAYAYREDQHVRVDVLYTKFSARGKAVADIVTSVFFFIFVGALLWTGARFALDSLEVMEHSFTEWGIQYWPVKLSIPIGAALLLLQGVAKLLKDIILLTQREA